MNERFDWSASIGRWFGVPIRMHLFFLTAVLLGMALEWNHRDHTPPIIGTGLVFGLVLFGTALIHELARLMAITHLGGHVDSITLMPWGGVSAFRMSDSPQQRLVAAAAGAFLNGCVFLFCAALLTQSSHSDFVELIHPFNPPEFYLGSWQSSLLSMIAWVNFQMLLLNLIPCFPFDGAEMARSALRALDVDVDASKVESTLMAMGQLIGFSLMGSAWLFRSYENGPIQPVWALLLLVGVLLLFCARVDYRQRMRQHIDNGDWDEPLVDQDYETEANYGSMNFLTDEGYSQWLVEKHQERERNRYEIEQEIETDEAHQVDEILSKLHTTGLDGLTEDEHGLLERVSARIRLKRQLDNVD